jgi:hypothetical protein
MRIVGALDVHGRLITQDARHRDGRGAARAHQPGDSRERPPVARAVWWARFSIDPKKKELAGEFKNAGRRWHPEGRPPRVNTHDFLSIAAGKAIPYGIYEIARDSGFVSVGIDRDHRLPQAGAALLPSPRRQGRAADDRRMKVKSLSTGGWRSAMVRGGCG